MNGFLKGLARSGAAASSGLLLVIGLLAGPPATAHQAESYRAGWADALGQGSGRSADVVTVMVAGGGGHSLALKADGTVWAWGANFAGQLGDGTTTSRVRAVQVV